jgi:hypothetical protein
MPRDITLRLASASLVSLGALGLAGLAAAADVDEPRLAALQQQLAQVQRQVNQVVEENRSLREAQQQLERQLAQLSRAAAPVAGGEAGPAVAGASQALAAAPPAAGSAALPTPASPAYAALGEGLRLWGYGEIYYTDPTHDARRVRADLARAVFGIGYSFDNRTEFNSEYEVEHAVSSASDAGEFEVEQFYVDRRVSDALSVRAGLLLMPFGFLNEHHEPTRFYGVQRNFVETLVIPSTWREGGVALHGDTSGGLGWSVGLTTGFDLSKWDYAPPFPPYASALELVNSHAAPLPATHQELQLANARDLSQYLALSYYGVPGLLVGGAVSSGNAVKATIAGAPGPGAQRVTLWEAHARWTPSKLDLAALYARGTIGNTALANAANPGSPNPIPSSFYGYFVQGAYELWEQGGYRAAPFVRFERYNLGASYSGTSGPAVPTGLVPLSGSPGDLGYWPANDDRVWTAGANLYLGTHVVVKGDYQRFRLNSSFSRFDLGLGVSF